MAIYRETRDEGRIRLNIKLTQQHKTLFLNTRYSSLDVLVRIWSWRQVTSYERETKNKRFYSSLASRHWVYRRSLELGISDKKRGRRNIKAFPCLSSLAPRHWFMVGVIGFEPTTLGTPCRCATRLRYTPKKNRKNTCFEGALSYLSSQQDGML